VFTQAAASSGTKRRQSESGAGPSTKKACAVLSSAHCSVQQCVCVITCSLRKCTRAQAATITAPCKSVKGLTVFAYDYTGAGMGKGKGICMGKGVGHTRVITFKSDEQDPYNCTVDFGEFLLPKQSSVNKWPSDSNLIQRIKDILHDKPDIVTWHRDFNDGGGQLVPWSGKWKSACRLLDDYNGTKASKTLWDYLVSHIYAIEAFPCPIFVVLSLFTHFVESQGDEDDDGVCVFVCVCVACCCLCVDWW
jgi:hypothetical protein